MVSDQSGYNVELNTHIISNTWQAKQYSSQQHTGLGTNYNEDNTLNHTIRKIQHVRIYGMHCIMYSSIHSFYLVDINSFPFSCDKN